MFILHYDKVNLIVKTLNLLIFHINLNCMISSFQRRSIVIESTFNLQIEDLKFEAKKNSITCNLVLQF